jgi:anaerobic magnesium-protoporphyrin IX monomethyl ester cyclase
MKIVFIYPHFKVIPYNGVSEPLGVLYVISVLRREGFNDIDFIDMTFINEYVEMDEKLKKADVIAFTCTSPSLHWHIKNAVEYVRSVNPKATFISGGSHSTLSSPEVLSLGFDYAFQGEAEISFPEFLRALDGNGDPRKVRGLAYMEDGKCIINERADVVKDLDTIPFPARDLLNYEGYVQKDLTEYGMVSLRGCPYNCLYCQPTIKILFGKVRKRSAKNVADEVESVIKMRGQGIRIYFKDETMGLHGAKWFCEFRDEIKTRKLDFTWHCNTRVNTVTEEMLEAMADSGCICISFGVESGSEKILSFYDKTIKLDQTKNAFKLCHKYGIEPTANVMLGAPEETLEDLEKTYKLIKVIKPDDIAVYFCTAIPGKYIYDYAKEHGLLNKDIDWVEYDTARNREEEHVNIKLLHVTIDDLKRYKKKILRYRSMRKITSIPNITKWLKEAASNPGLALKKAGKVLSTLRHPVRIESHK